VDDILQSYSWPGNVRQLENVINRISILAEDGRITLLDLPAEISRPRASHEGADRYVAAAGDLREQLRQAEAKLIANALNDAGGDRKIAAQNLGIGLSSLYRKLEDLGSGRDA
jgi:two-component system response regulator AtoC